MTFREQYEAALTVKAAACPETIPNTSYFAGTFYELLDSTAERLPTVLSGGSIEIGEAFSLLFKPLGCRLLLYTQEGSGTLLLPGRDCALTAGSLLYLDCRNLSFSLTAVGHPWRIVAFSLGGGLFSVYESLVPFHTFLLAQTDVYSPIVRDLKQLLAGSAGAALENKLRDSSLITAILTELFIDAFHLEREDTTCAPYLRELRHYIDNHLTSHIRLGDLERLCHMSKYRICHEFSAAFVLPPLKYLNKKRMEAAENLLLSTQKKIHEIALETGYENTNHFINLFKKEYGATPQAYREAHQN
ncbi:MAG: AraC family transcriptional regulator [Lachnospiraceae bacterium]|nr:AraC family transcriptional regulator [Lachnospiraceae bacterium]